MQELIINQDKNNNKIVALVENGKLVEKYEERTEQKRLEGNIEFLYDLNPYNKNMNLGDKRRNQFKTAFSKTLFPMYGGIAILIIVFILLKSKGVV